MTSAATFSMMESLEKEHAARLSVITSSVFSLEPRDMFGQVFECLPHKLS